MSDATPEITAWVEQQEAAGARYDLGVSTFSWARQPVSLVHTRREYAQAWRRIAEQIGVANGTIRWDEYDHLPFDYYRRLAAGFGMPIVNTTDILRVPIDPS